MCLDSCAFMESSDTASFSVCPPGPSCSWVHMMAYLMRISMMLLALTCESIALWSNGLLVLDFSQSWHFILFVSCEGLKQMTVKE